MFSFAYNGSTISGQTSFTSENIISNPQTDSSHLSGGSVLSESTPETGGVNDFFSAFLHFF